MKRKLIGNELAHLAIYFMLAIYNILSGLTVCEAELADLSPTW